MYKSILVHVDIDDPGTPDRITAAASLAHNHHATLIGVAAALPPEIIEVAESERANVNSQDTHELDEQFSAARSLFDHWTDKTVDTEWRTAIGSPTHAVTQLAARADLMVVGGPRRSRPANSYLDYGGLVMSAGRPVLAVPHAGARFEAEPAVVAWRNTRECRRALSDALPLLAEAGEVHLVHVNEASDNADERTSLSEAGRFLDRHAIGSSTHTLELGSLSPAQRIIEFAARVAADLVVCGAYGHTRMREWAFGGVTRDLIRGCPVPCLLSH